MVTLHWKPNITTVIITNALQQEVREVLSTVVRGFFMRLVMIANGKYALACFERTLD